MPIAKNDVRIGSYYVFVNAAIWQIGYLWYLMFKIIVWTFVVVMLYRFFTRFVLPIAKMTRTAKEQMQRMQQQMQDMHQQQQAQPKTAAASRHIDGDYIEYEEVK